MRTSVSILFQNQLVTTVLASSRFPSSSTPASPSPHIGFIPICEGHSNGPRIVTLFSLRCLSTLNGGERAALLRHHHSILASSRRSLRHSAVLSPPTKSEKICHRLSRLNLRGYVRVRHRWCPPACTYSHLSHTQPSQLWATLTKQEGRIVS